MATTTIYPFGQPGATLASQGYVVVDELPTASASTMGPIYILPNEETGISTLYVTAVSDGAYVWQSIGTTDIDLTGYVKGVSLTQEEYDALVQAGTLDPTIYYFVNENEE